MSKCSAGILMYRQQAGGLEVFLVHPGGPYFANKDARAWGIPKGEYEKDEEPLAAAQREFTEETGFTPKGTFHELGSVKQKSGKVVVAWAIEGDCDPAELVSNTCKIEWPPRSGKLLEIPEVDQGRWFRCNEAREWIRMEQVPLLDSLESLVGKGRIR